VSSRRCDGHDPVVLDKDVLRLVDAALTLLGNDQHGHVADHQSRHSSSRLVDMQHLVQPQVQSLAEEAASVHFGNRHPLDPGDTDSSVDDIVLY